MGSKSRVLSVILRLLQMALAATIIGLLAHELHMYRTSRVTRTLLGPVIAMEVLAILSLLLATLFLVSMLRRFIHYPIDLLLVPLWLAAAALAVLVSHTCIQGLAISKHTLTDYIAFQG